MADKKKKKSLAKTPEMEEIEVFLSSGEKVRLKVPRGSTEQEIAGFLAQVDSGPRPDITPQAQPDSPQAESSFRRFLRGATGSTTPVQDVLQGLGSISESAARLGPTGLLIGGPQRGGALDLLLTELPKSLLKGQAEQLEKVTEASIDPQTGKFSTSRFLFNPEVGGRTLAGVTPIVGPAAANLTDQLLSSNIAEPLGTFTTLLLGLGIPKAVGVLKGRSLTGAKLKAANKTLKAIKPPKGIRIKVKDSLPFIFDEIKKLGTPIRTMQDLSDAARSIRLRIGSEMNEVLGRGKAGVIDGNRLADVVIDNISESSRILDNATVARIERSVNKTLRKDFTLLEAENLRQSLNSKLSFFFKKNKLSQKASATTPEIAHELALRAALESEIEALLEAGGEGLKGLRKQYSSAVSVESAVADRILTDLIKENPTLLSLDSLDTIAAGSGITALLLGQPQTAAALGLTVASRRVITLLENRMRSPDIRVRNAFAPKGVGVSPGITTGLKTGAILNFLIPDKEPLTTKEKLKSLTRPESRIP